VVFVVGRRHLHIESRRPCRHPPAARRPQSLFGDKLYGEGNGSLSFGEYLATVVAGGRGGSGSGDGAGGDKAAATAKAS
jgi:hypothetical protein